MPTAQASRRPPGHRTSIGTLICLPLRLGAQSPVPPRDALCCDELTICRQKQLAVAQDSERREGQRPTHAASARNEVTRPDRCPANWAAAECRTTHGSDCGVSGNDRL